MEEKRKEESIDNFHSFFSFWFIANNAWQKEFKVPHFQASCINVQKVQIYADSALFENVLK